MKKPIIFIHGAPGCGKTTVAGKLHEKLKCPWFEFGWIPEFRHLNPHTEISYAQESQMTFETLALVAKNYVSHGFEHVILSDIEDRFIPQISEFYGDDYLMFTLYSNDDALIKERILTRGNGNMYKNFEAAIALNQTIKSRPLYSTERRICSDTKPPDDIAAEILEAIESTEQRRAQIYPTPKPPPSMLT
jgi:hypothetical protein